MALAETLAGLLQAGDVLTLEGDLGAGKTHFTKGLAAGLGVKTVVNSPTFTIIKEYSGQLPLYHMDVYRLTEEDEELGLEEYFQGDGVSVVEWAHLMEQQLPKEKLTCSLRHLGEDKRLLVFKAQGERYERLLKEFSL